jgi:hypothetical protein
MLLERSEQISALPRCLDELTGAHAGTAGVLHAHAVQAIEIAEGFAPSLIVQSDCRGAPRWV